MSEILVKNKTVVIPGEVLALGLDFLPAQGTFRDGEQIIAQKMGMAIVDGRIIKILPLAGKYLPKGGDIIIGKIIDVTFSGWRVELNSPYSALLSMKDATSEFIGRGADLTRYYNFGDYIVTKIINVTSQNLVDLSMLGPGLRKLPEGRILHVMPSKVPRIIGKQGSMVMMLKESTGCQIVVGQNGVVWINGTPQGENKAAKAIQKIEEESHLSGLTDRIKQFLGELS